MHPTTRRNDSSDSLGSAGPTGAPDAVVVQTRGALVVLKTPDDPVTGTRRELADELGRLRARLSAGETDHQRSAEERAPTRHEIGLVRERLRNAAADDEEGTTREQHHGEVPRS